MGVVRGTPAPQLRQLSKTRSRAIPCRLRTGFPPDWRKDDPVLHAGYPWSILEVHRYVRNTGMYGSYKDNYIERTDLPSPHHRLRRRGRTAFSGAIRSGARTTRIIFRITSTMRGAHLDKDSLPECNSMYSKYNMSIISNTIFRKYFLGTRRPPTSQGSENQLPKPPELP